MKRYQHTQFGYVTTITMAAAAVLILALMADDGFSWVALAVLLILGASIALFATLTVEIDDEKLVVYFGPGAIRKAIALEDILSCEMVTDPWYYGWGIRLTPHGWLWRVSGLEGVELLLKNGARFRIGTDEPRRLQNAIEVAVGPRHE